MNSIRKYWAIAVVSAKSNLAYVAEVGSRVFFISIILYIFMTLWKSTFANAHATAFGGYNLDELIWYLAMTETIMMSSPRVTPRVDEDVRTGTIAVQLVRPLSYPLYRLASNLGEQAVRFAVTVLAAAAIALWLAKPPAQLLNGMLFAALALPGAFVLDFLGYFLVGLGAFWMEDTTGLMLIYSRLTMIAGGMLLPLELFPQNVQYILKALPFGCIVSGPARQLVHPDLLVLAGLLAQQMFWIVLLGIATSAVYNKAVQRIALQGG